MFHICPAPGYVYLFFNFFGNHMHEMRINTTTSETAAKMHPGNSSCLLARVYENGWICWICQWIYVYRNYPLCKRIKKRTAAVLELQLYNIPKFCWRQIWIWGLVVVQRAPHAVINYLLEVYQTLFVCCSFSSLHELGRCPTMQGALRTGAVGLCDSFEYVRNRVAGKIKLRSLSQHERDARTRKETKCPKRRWRW